MYPLSLQSGGWDALDKESKAFTLLPQLLKYYLWVSMQVVAITYQRVLIVRWQCRPLLDHEALHPTDPDLHFIDHVAYDLYRRPFACCGAMSDSVVIAEERPAKDGWNLADLGSPLFLLGGHSFLLWSTPYWGELRFFHH
jgi:hypothetical protein